VLVLELARFLSLDDQQTRQLLEASLTALAPCWSVPLPRNPYFTGREALLSALHRQLGAEPVVALTPSWALHGLGGIGKTQMALEYAYRSALSYRAVFWIAAETQEQIVSSFLRVAQVLGLPEREDKDVPRVVPAVQRWLSTHDQWLLIWDNVEDLGLLQRFLPATRSGAMLLTTRLHVLGTLARGINLLPMEQEEGMLFLLRRAKVLGPEAQSQQMHQLARQRPQQYAAAAELVNVLGGLPLALDQAGAYMEETRCGMFAYLDLFYTRRADRLGQRGEGARDHPASVSTTLTLSILSTAQRHRTVEDLLCVCALLQAEAIPEELFRQGGEHLGATLAAACGDPLEGDHLVGVACSYSLLARQPEEQTLSLHRLVQAVLLERMTETQREHWTRRTLRALEAVFPEVLPTTAYGVWKRCERLVLHALLCLQHLGSPKEALVWAELSYKVAQYQCERGQYRAADPLYRRALQIQEHALGSAHPAVASTLAGQANLYRRQGNYAQAEPLHLRALQIREQALGPAHPAVASSLNDLANLYSDQGRYRELEALRVRSLQIREQTLRPDHPDVAASLNNLALLYQDQSRYGEAEALYERALQIQEQALGPEHHLVSTVLNDLANLYRDQEKYMQAETLYQRALSLREHHLGLHHPDTAETLHDLAFLRQKQGNLSEAFSLAERAHAIRSQALGDLHPRTVASRKLAAHLVQERERAEVEGASRHRPQAIPDRRRNEGYENGASSLLHQAVTPAPSGDDPLQAFLDACCELHPRAWCHSADLWLAYQAWTESQHERSPLSRAAFTEQLKALGCRAGRTNSARIWRGITLVNQETVTRGDRR
jgi:tetratricopeptide (TPR) repeat protein